MTIGRQQLQAGQRVDYKDYYRILGVERQANEQQIKQAYRRLARQFHPDVNTDPSAEDRFKEINEAYTVLSDAEKRRRYDELGSRYYAWQRAGRRNSEFDWSQWTQTSTRRRDSSGGIFSDFFSSIFGETQTRSRNETSNKIPLRGQDLEQEVSVTLLDAFQGTTRHIRRGNRSFSAHIPAGVQTGTKIRFAEQGEGGAAGGAPGDLYLTIQVEDHPAFERRGDDLHVEIDVPLPVAVLGGDVRCTTLEGDVRLKIPQGTQSGQSIRVRGRGMPLLRNSEERGDLYARVLIKLPLDLTEEDYEYFEQLAERQSRYS